MQNCTKKPCHHEATLIAKESTILPLLLENWKALNASNNAQTTLATGVVGVATLEVLLDQFCSTLNRVQKWVNSFSST